MRPAFRAFPSYVLFLREPVRSAIAIAIAVEGVEHENPFHIHFLMSFF